MKKSNEQIAVRVSTISILLNSALAVFKLIAGIVGNSGAMLSDAVHTLSDVLGSFIVIVAVKLAGRDSDDDHQYGHERFECVAAILLAALLFATGLGIGYSGVTKILSADYGELEIPGLLALTAAVVSIVVKEGMYWWTRAAAKKINSGALMAEAWHHRSDALSSIGSFAGILGARLGLPVLDPIAAVVICVFIVKAAITIFKDAIRKMTDEACDHETSSKIEELITSEDGVLGIDKLQTRVFGNKIYVDVEIAADGELSLTETHGIAESVHDSIERSVPNVKHCMVHVNPRVCDL